MNFKIGDFEGPLDLLYNLIKIREYEIEAVHVLDIIEQYVELTVDIDRDLENASDFIVMASDLIAMKARYLNGGEMEEEDENQENPLENLVEKLRYYKKIKEASDILSAKYEHTFPYFREQMDYVVEEELKLEVGLLKQALLRVMMNLERYDDERQQYFQTIKREVHTVDSKMAYIHKLLNTTKRLEFSTLCLYREEIVVTFLALLELLKSKHIFVRQDGLFKEIYIERRYAEQTNEYE